jgi:hypothetical protein
MKPSRFIRKVWSLQEQPEAFYCLSTKSRNGRWKDHFFNGVPNERKLRKFFDTYPDDLYHLYFSPLPFRDRKRNRELVVGSRLLWADLDEAHPRKIILVPQISWESSPSRYASLWILNRFHTPLEIEPVNKNLSYASGADRAGWDLAQVLRIPGTINLKYDDKPTGKLLWFTDNIYTIKQVPRFSPKSGDSGKLIRKYKKRIGSSTLKTLTAKKADVGKRSDVIWRLNNELQEAGVPPEDVFTLIKFSVWNKFADRNDEDRQLEREISKVSVNQPQPKINGTNILENTLVRMSAVEPENVKWLWWPYIPESKITLIEGDPSTGKSYMTLSIAAHITTGKRLPLSKKSTRGKVLLLCGEDGPEDTIRPRLDQVGADSNKVWLLNQTVTFDEEGVEEVDGVMSELKPKLLIIDPLNTYLSGVDTHKATETREVLHQIIQLAARYKTTVLAVRHFTKGKQDKLLYRGQGSMELAAAARSIIQVGRDPRDEDMRAMYHIKSNLGPAGCPIGFGFDFSKKHPFKWTGKSDLRPKEIADTSIEDVVSTREEAKDFLISILSKGPVLSDKIKQEGESRSISLKHLKQARKSLGIKIQFKKKGVVWSLGK